MESLEPEHTDGDFLASRHWLKVGLPPDPFSPDPRKKQNKRGTTGAANLSLAVDAEQPNVEELSDRRRPGTEKSPCNTIQQKYGKQ